jgi:hypothetical protein
MDKKGEKVTKDGCLIISKEYQCSHLLRQLSSMEGVEKKAKDILLGFVVERTKQV